MDRGQTEDGIVTELIKAGVPREDITLAFHEAEDRSFKWLGRMLQQKDQSPKRTKLCIDERWQPLPPHLP